MSPGATKLLEILRQITIDGRRYVVCWNDPKPETIPHDALIVRFPRASMRLLLAERLDLPLHADVDLMALHDSMEKWLSELSALGLVNEVAKIPGFSTPIVYERADGKVVSLSYEKRIVSSQVGREQGYMLCVAVEGVSVGEHNIEVPQCMFELTPKGAEVALTPKRDRRRSPARRPNRTEPTEREKRAMVLRARGFTYDEVGDEMGITKQRAYELVQNGTARQRPSGRSVKTTRLPTDHRGQETTVDKSGRRRKKSLSGD